jgi:type II secretory pathway pseudopilin PulG
MNIPDTGYLLFAIIILAVVAALVFILKPAGQKKKLSRLAAIVLHLLLRAFFLVRKDGGLWIDGNRYITGHCRHNNKIR